MNTIDINLQVVPIITFFGKKYLYKLPDSVYGEWIICKNGYPKYYFSVFDKDYESLNIKEGLDIESYLKDKLRKIDSSLTVGKTPFGIWLTNKSFIKRFTLEKISSIILK